MTKTRAQVEAWAIGVVDHVVAGHDVEDDRVELKREFTSGPRIARRLAGHANAARGDSILWVFGVDERARHVAGMTGDFNDWWPQVQAEFVDDVPRPDLFWLNYDGVRLAVLYIAHTDRAPFVVKNPAFGTERGGPVEAEVPWREGASTRSAGRTDLLRILTPAPRVPTVDVRWAQVQALSRSTNPPSFNLSVKARCYLELTVPPPRPGAFPPAERDRPDLSMIETVVKGVDQIVAMGAGFFVVQAFFRGAAELQGDPPALLGDEEIQLDISIGVVELDRPIRFSVTMLKDVTNEGHGTWEYVAAGE